MVHTCTSRVNAIASRCIHCWTSSEIASICHDKLPSINKDTFPRCDRVVNQECLGKPLRSCVATGAARGGLLLV
eukprot:2846518-Amphidinium_carterae.1